MRRREFISLLGGAAVAWPLAARAQQPAGKFPRIGSISNFPNENFEAFIQGLREAGHVDGQNMLLETRFHRGTLAGIDQFASELVALKCDVILATAPYAIQAVMNATSTIPIVGIDLESDPVASGWVKSLARPGGNFTGLFLDIPELGGKQIELLKEAVPMVARLAVLWDATIGTVQFHATDSGQAAAPPSSAMNSRRFMCSPGWADGRMGASYGFPRIAHTSLQQEPAALRHFNPAYVADGSFATGWSRRQVPPYRLCPRKRK